MIVEEASYLRGYIPWALQKWGVYFWFVTYRDGFIKRGLVGAIFQSFEKLRSGARAPDLSCLVDVCIAYTVLSQSLMLILAVMFVDSLARVPKREKSLIALAWFTFAASQFLPTIAYEAGYVDVLILLACVIALLAWRTERYWLAAAIAGIAPLIHEEFVFFWLCPAILMLSAARRGARARCAHFLVALAPVLSTAGTMLAHSPHATQLQLARSPLEPAVKEALLQVQFGQSLASAMTATLAKAIAGWKGAMVLAPIELIPTMLILALAGRAWSSRDPSFGRSEIVATMAPLSILLVAWDFSRYLVVTNFMAILCTYVATRRRETA